MSSVYFQSSGSGYLSIASNSAIALGSGDFTLEMFVYNIGSSGSLATQHIWDQRNGTSGAGVIQPLLLTGASGYIWYVAGANRIVSGAAAAALYSWNHLAVSRSSGVTKMFVNGTQANSDYVDTNNYPAGSLRIGQNNDGTATNQLFDGYIADLRVTVGNALYTANFTPPTSLLVASANTKLLTCNKNNKIADFSSSNLVITTSGSVYPGDRSPYNTVSMGSGVIMDESYNSAIEESKRKGRWGDNNIGPNYNSI